MNKRSVLGKEGEDAACEHLVNKGFKILERNYRRPWGEIDIIGIAPDKTLVFVEVKTIKNDFSQGIKPEDQMTKNKLRKFKKSATLYAGEKPEFVKDNKGWRLDLLALTKIGNDFLIKHYEQII